jgi:hypothetical protein
MKTFLRFSFVWVAAFCAFLTTLLPSPVSAQASATIKRIAISDGAKGTELQISASQPVATDTRVLTDPDRVVIDFPGAVPGNQLKGFPVNRGQIKAVRTGLYTSNPPTTRVVIVLKAPLAYQVVPAGSGVVVKFSGAPNAPLDQAAEKASQDPIPIKATRPSPIPVKSAAPGPIPIIVRTPQTAPRAPSPETSSPEKPSPEKPSPHAPSSQMPSATTATIKRVALLGNQKGMELEITANQPVATDTRVLTDPDRVVIDFPGALPGDQLKGFAVNHGAMKGVRVALLSSSPPTTRVVLDLNAPSPYQVFPSGNTVLVKLGSGPNLPGPAPVPAPHAVLPPAPRVAVNFKDGQLTIDAEKATLAEVLYQVHMTTGADIAIPAGAERETVIVKAGPGLATKVMSEVLNGSHFNFVVVGSEQDQNALRSIILTAKNGEESPPAPESAPAMSEEIPSEVPTPNDGNATPVAPPVSSLPQVPMPPDQSVPVPVPPDPPPDQPQ